MELFKILFYDVFRLFNKVLWSKGIIGRILIKYCKYALVLSVVFYNIMNSILLYLKLF